MADPPATPAPDPVRDAARRCPGNPALIADDTTLTWAQLDERVDRAARFLASRAHRGDRIAIVLGNTIGFAVAYFATLRAGLVAVPLNPGYAEDELACAIADCGAAYVVEEDVTGDGPPPAAPGPAADDLAVLLYTSGTSGRPKGAMLTHRALAANHEQLARIEPPVLGPADVVLLAIPFFHAYGLNTGLGAVAHHGACGVLVDRFDPAATTALIAAHRVTAVVGVPSMYAAWSLLPDVDLGSVRTAVCGAAPLDPGVAARFTAATGKTIMIGYGLTEAAPVLTTTAVSDRTKVGSIGRPLPGISLLLRTAAGDVVWRDGVAAPAPDDDWELDLGSAGTDPGEIVVRGANLFSGYWPDGRDGPDADGWWATGDIAYADAGGDLVLVDRIGELILVNGFNVYPAEIERVLDAHPGVAESAVIAIPDERTGQAPYAYVVPALDPAPTEAELQVFLGTRLARFKLPTGIELVDALPHSATGKVRKGALG
ncbi:class I adenylate-forming enzyme family protein [Actinoplanes sp. N902-109]|uniref:class I adenylate-forming enzyme family protein n=1 Tax=Actinoplanes sp. (strain N902-109) TaxID=649831 RepID=UPI0003294AA4|nr:AMP-binding protein [Actinoplanes sp. N902-109]AGL21161.1 amp-dependent synthetase and ligase [Actinoplanes sp. N902-109]